MKPFKSTRRLSAALVLASASAMVLSACSAGQISQTSSQVAAVDGASAESSNGAIAVRDVTVQVAPDGTAGVKFTAINQDDTNADHTLKSVSIDGVEASLKGDSSLKHGCSLVANIPSEMKKLVEPKGACVNHISTTIANPGFSYGGTKEVTFVFDDSTIVVDATTAAPVLESGQHDREHSHTEH
ncbi:MULTISPECIES: hypothetical protein [unclassified Corynebacterium]|uniref:hypothetical protein n=1 Tax=unclassified Corynebacterium TaxID=2624378 RepID=UPI0037BFE52C